MNPFYQPEELFDDQIIEPCKVGEIFDFVWLDHYSGTCQPPGLASYCFADRMGGVLVGAAVFGHSEGNVETGSIFKPPYNTKHDCRELLRLVMIDGLPRGSSRRFMLWMLDWLRQNTKLNGLVSYADPEQKNLLTGEKHDGAIYRASNWLYTGLQEQGSRRFIINGQDYSEKSVTEQFGTCSKVKLEAMGLTVEPRTALPKHRYVYVLNKHLKSFLKYKIVPFVASIILADSGTHLPAQAGAV